MGKERKTGTGKSGGWDMTNVTLIDMGEKPRCKTVFELTLDKGDEDLREVIEEGEQIEVSVLSIEAGFKASSPMRISGRITRQVAQEPARGRRTQPEAPAA